MSAPTRPTPATLYDELGPERLQRIVEDFIGRVFSDVMIGYLFRNVDRAHLQRMEFQFAARHLGAPLRYEGRPLLEAHAPHPILGGHFNRRRELLRRTLADHAVPSHIVDHWIAHTEALRPQVTRDLTNHCEPEPGEPKDDPR